MRLIFNDSSITAIYFGEICNSGVGYAIRKRHGNNGIVLSS